LPNIKHLEPAKRLAFKTSCVPSRLEELAFSSLVINLFRLVAVHNANTANLVE
jgi:hypothetical protein